MSMLSRQSASRRVAPVESLEQRCMLHNVLLAPIPDVSMGSGGAAQTINLSQHIDYEEVNGTLVDLQTNFGTIPLELTDAATPGTVANFLKYVTENRYDNTIFHRLADGSGGSKFVLQGGGFTNTRAPVETYAAIPNEYSDSRPNTVGTIAMAKLGGDPNSATSQFFFNLSDNTNILNSSQNGGFTTFGRARDLTTINSIASLSTTNEGGAFAELPADANGTVPMVTDAVIVPENTYTVTSSNPAVVNPTINGTQLALTPTGSGSSDVTVTATAFDGSTLSETFAVNISNAAASVIVGPGADQSRSVVFVDADGTRTTVSATNATATLSFDGANVTTDTRNRVTTVAGDNLSLSNIAVANVTRVTSALNIVAAGGDGVVNVPDISVDGTLGTLNAARGILTGDVTTTGGLGRVNLAQINGGSLTSQTAGLALALNAGSVTDASINTAGAIRTLTVGNWTNPGGTGTLTATSIGRISSTGDFGPDVNASGGLGSFTTRGNVTGGTWNIAGGAASTVSAQNTLDGWIGVFAGAVRSVAVRGTLDGALAAGSIGTLTAGTLSAPVRVTDTTAPFALGTLNVTNLTDAEVRSDGSIRSINVRGGSTRSGIYAGIGGGETDVLAPSDFTNPNAQIVNARFNAARGSAAFSDSAIIAPILGNINLGALSDAPGTLPFTGVASDQLRQLQFTSGAQRVRLNGNLPITEQLAAQNVLLNNVDIVVL